MAYINQNSEMSILVHVFNTAVFNNSAFDDITLADLGEEQMSVELESDSVNRLLAVTQTIISSIFLCQR
ncbi:Uncharacterised protein [Helicobacter acinonychis]|nr:Uncharacterised protein [Helicobacter acinonychis]